MRNVSCSFRADKDACMILPAAEEEAVPVLTTSINKQYLDLAGSQISCSNLPTRAHWQLTLAVISLCSFSFIKAVRWPAHRPEPNPQF